ncbi:GH3 family domain-containing protein [Lacipirellula limnantheis]|uniref:GH3 family domain-containing protein n=1 Tax=Lacipirellula limnantheis TaxID=2528024 RepID=UPI001AEF7257
MPSIVARSPDIASCRYATLFYLLRDHRLSLISVWSPTFLTELKRFLWANWEQLCPDVELGRMSSSAYRRLQSHAGRPGVAKTVTSDHPPRP